MAKIIDRLIGRFLGKETFDESEYTKVLVEHKDVQIAYSTLSAMERRLKDVEDKLSELSSEKVRNQHRIDEINARLAQIDNELKALLDAMNSTQDAGVKFQLYQQEMQLNNERNSLIAEKNNLTSRNSGIDSEIGVLTSEKDELSTKIKQIKDKYGW